MRRPNSNTPHSRDRRAEPAAEAEPCPADRVLFELDDAQWAQFTAMLNAPPKDSPGLRRLFARKPIWEQ